MRLLLPAFFLMVLGATGQNPRHFVTIHLPQGVPSEKVYIRYILESEELGGTVAPRPGVMEYVISTARGEHAVALFKALVYAPGCAIQTVSLELSDQTNPRVDFVCEPAPSATIVGRFNQPERIGEHNVRLQLMYVARWAQAFLGLGQVVVSFPLGDPVNVDAGERFRLTVPVLRTDGAEIQVRATDRTTGQDFGLIVPAANSEFSTRMGGLKMANAYPDEIVFMRCGNRTRTLIDRQALGQRQGDDRCDR
jgi:hypothetical protein